MHLTLIAVSRMLVWPFIFVLKTNSLMHLTVALSALNTCRRASGAGYQHGDRKGCLRGTRETVLNEIESWTKDPNKSPVFWLNGLAGTGKSTIAQTASERVFADGLLGASFFCSRDFKDRSDLHFIFPTLAFQLAHKYPKFRSILVPLLQSNPDIAHESLYNQMKMLIAEPLSSSDISTVIVIDALDECKDKEPSSVILSVLGRFVEKIPRVKFFITGRPESRIQTGFRLPLLSDVTSVFVLHKVQPSLINNDIRLFIKYELSELAKRRGLDGWPSNNDLNVLCHRAAGFFVYAVATVKFLDSNSHLPKQQLDMIISLPESTAPEGKTMFKPEATLDFLYTSVLKTAFTEEDPKVDSKVRSTIGAVILLVNPLPPYGIAELIGLATQEVTLFLTPIQSLLILDEDSTQPVKPFHKSFPDFITNPSRCTNTRLCVSPKDLHLELVMGCLGLMNDRLEQNLLSLPDYALNSEVEDLQTRIDDHISVGLQYACQHWHSHLTEAEGGVTNIVSSLHIFLEGKFLAWLEVVSVLGAARGAVVALEKLMSWLQEVCLVFFAAGPYTKIYHNQVAQDKELLDIARDCSHFMTKFFEPINVSATHIYHSALELSPLSSNIRRLYYHQRLIPLPRVVVGTPDLWDQSLALPYVQTRYGSCTWSPSGQFVAVRTEKAVEIRDPLNFELLSTLQPSKPTSQLIGAPAYSPDGHSLASLSKTSLIIWDVQTGGVAKEIPRGKSSGGLVVWSLDGRAVGTMTPGQVVDRVWAIHTYDITSGTRLSPGQLRSEAAPQLWAYDTSFRAVTVQESGQAHVISIFEVGSTLRRVELFHINLGTINTWVKFFSGQRWAEIISFSPTTYRVSALFAATTDWFLILDIRNSRCLLKQKRLFHYHSFSSDGSLFAASLFSLHVWKYTSGRYTPWREFPSSVCNHPCFSPTLSSILGLSQDAPRIWHLDGPLIVAHPNHNRPLTIPSPCGTYVVAGHERDSTITITNLLSQTPNFINTGMKINTFTLTGSILLVEDSKTITAWRLTGEGAVEGVLGNRRAGHRNRIWTIPRSPILEFVVEDQTVTIWDGTRDKCIHIYHTGTGEVLKPAQVPPYNPHHWDTYAMHLGQHYTHYHTLNEDDTCPEDNWPVSQTALQEGWVKDPEGKHQLWIPAIWRQSQINGGWLYNIRTLWIKPNGGDIIIKF
jgi:hypothetical protein